MQNIWRNNDRLTRFYKNLIRWRVIFYHMSTTLDIIKFHTVLLVIVALLPKVSSDINASFTSMLRISVKDWSSPQPDMWDNSNNNNHQHAPLNTSSSIYMPSYLVNDCPLYSLCQI